MPSTVSVLLMVISGATEPVFVVAFTPPVDVPLNSIDKQERTPRSAKLRGTETWWTLSIPGSVQPHFPCLTGRDAFARSDHIATNLRDARSTISFLIGHKYGHRA